MNFRKIYFVGFILLGIISCAPQAQKHEGYTFNEKGFYYKLLAFSDDYRRAQVTDYVTATIQFSPVNNDSLDIKERFVIEVSNEDSICLPMLLFDVKQGDSISFIVPNTNSIRNILSQEFADLFTAYSEIKLVVKVHSVVNKGTYEQQKKQFDLWSKSQREYEREILKNYVAKSNYPFALTSQGIYKYIIKQGTGVLPQKDDIISINYQGSLLSREIINHFTSLEFAFGSQWQVIDGIERAIKTMREGERAIILVSSDYAWGADGTSDGSIAPFTSVQYDLELVSVTKPTRQKN